METSAIRVQGMPIVLAILLMVLTGCASNYKDFKVSDVDDDEGVVIGKINVVYNGKPHTELCRICINSSCQELTKEGLVFMPLDKGPAQIEELHCKNDASDKLVEQNQAFQEAGFEVRQGVTYFGEVTFDWENEHPLTFMKQVAVGYMLGSGTAGSYAGRLHGKIKMSVRDDITPVLNSYQQQVGNESVQAEKSIITVGHQAK